MQTLQLTPNPAVEEKFQTYPEHVRKKLLQLRNLILETATESNIPQLEETLKWGEPSYLTEKGSTIRIDWKSKTPNRYTVYFKCTSKLVVTFKELFGDTFRYENNRAIIFNFNDEVPVDELKICIRLALTYHSVKDKPLLGE
ncbi:MAG: DUF1801 domain-containing protein [Spirosomataceae bacterium]